MILADCHVHIYPCFNLQNFLNSAWENFRLQAKQQGNQESFSAFLLLTEGAGEKYFQDLSAMVDGEKNEEKNTSADWFFCRTGEKGTLHAKSNNGGELYLVAGRQIVTAENLEVLAVFTNAAYEEGKPLSVTVDAVRANGGIPIIPWGTGKWFGTRGKILKEYITLNNQNTFFLGDNSGRPFFWPNPSLFNYATKLGIRVLPGSDPLPFPSESVKPGSFGLTIKNAITEMEFPASQFKEILLDDKSKFQPYGQLETFFRFFYHQMTMQVVKRK